MEIINSKRKGIFFTVFHWKFDYVTLFSLAFPVSFIRDSVEKNFFPSREN